MYCNKDKTAAREVTVRIPTGRQAFYGVSGYINANAAGNWSNRFRDFNTSITLIFEHYTP
jgi:hypothetical protein